MTTNRRVTVFGAYGHTGRFVVSELRRRGWLPVLSGRSAGKLTALSAAVGGADMRPANVDDPASLDHALEKSAAVINCAGPFMDTSAPVIEAALRARIPYLDVTAEQPAALSAFERFSAPARAASVVIMPAMGFYGGLADLLATAAMGDWSTADEIHIAIALDSWHPTQGTRVTGRRNTAQRMIVANGQLEPLASPPPLRTWPFPPPFGTQEVVQLPFSEIMTIARHLRSRKVQSYMNLAPLKDIRNPDTPPPVPADASGRSSQRFVMDVTVEKGDDARGLTAQGIDIYAFTAPLVVEAMERLVTGRHDRAGVLTAGELFDAADFLAALTPWLSLAPKSDLDWLGAKRAG
jgi:short subunit dehydrogenase-like uncharacterized protein